MEQFFSHGGGPVVNDIPSSAAKHRDFPIESSRRDNARDLLETIGGLNFSERHVARLVAEGKLSLTSGAIETFVEEYRANSGSRATKKSRSPSIDTTGDFNPTLAAAL
jgi:hypothetical protein